MTSKFLTKVRDILSSCSSPFLQSVLVRGVVTFYEPHSAYDMYSLWVQSRSCSRRIAIIIMSLNGSIPEHLELVYTSPVSPTRHPPLNHRWGNDPEVRPYEEKRCYGPIVGNTIESTLNSAARALDFARTNVSESSDKLPLKANHGGGPSCCLKAVVRNVCIP